MHLTGGLFKGRIIPAPKGETQDVRPTLSKVRESVFNILSSHFLAQADNESLQDVFTNLSFLDMFSGSGIMALEALSRGFKNIAAIECNPKTYLLTKRAFGEFNANNAGKINLIKGNSLKIVPKLENFNVIYIDPPWDYNYEPVLFCALENLTLNGIAVVEYDKKRSNLPSALVPFKEKIYGRTGINFYKK